MSALLPEYRAAIEAVRPDLADMPMVVHTRGWDSNAVEAGDTIFKFPKHDEAVGRLRREAGFLQLVHPRVPLAVPDMILHEEPMLFSQHRMIPGTIIETAGYEALDEAQRQAMGDALGGFYAALHAIPVSDAVAVGAEPKPEWPAGSVVLPALEAVLPGDALAVARRAFAAYEALPVEDAVFGYFDGHGWNMAFDHERGVLNGVYDFADAAIGPRSREFVYSNLTAPDLTLRIIATYERLTGLSIDRRTVALRTAVQNLSELAEAEEEDPHFTRGVIAWLDYMQAREDMRI
ncbi:MAG: aminoglycoside phosphotransferase family protein [Hyphomicrobiales bacterium]|nr:MAG: aminoglycoside phosphotransferase family protein [Hyphomicrobiales bacterium]